MGPGPGLARAPAALGLAGALAREPAWVGATPTLIAGLTRPCPPEGHWPADIRLAGPLLGARLAMIHSGN